MTTSRQLHLIDKSSWTQDEWTEEPDRVEWIAHGLPCLAVRVPVHGAWCGYVGVRTTHPWAHLNYDDIHADVHGGITWASSNTAERYFHGLGITREEEEFCKHLDSHHDDDTARLAYCDWLQERDRFEEADIIRYDPSLWTWIGFDCAHYRDLTPKLLLVLENRVPRNTYKNLNYVMAETEKLAAQASSALLAHQAVEYVTARIPDASEEDSSAKPDQNR